MASWRPSRVRKGLPGIALVSGAAPCVVSLPLGWKAIVEDPAYQVPNVAGSLLLLYLPYPVLAVTARRSRARAFWTVLALLLGGSFLGLAGARSSSTGALGFLFILPAQVAAAAALGFRPFRR